MDSTHPIQNYMTPLPQIIGSEESLQSAIQKMREYRIRHLPVSNGKQVIGILSEGNAKAASLSQWANQFTVKDVMISDPYIVGPLTPLSSVMNTMIERKFGCAIVQSPEGEVVGIFTTIDALRLLRDLIGDRTEVPPMQRWPFWD